MNTLFETYCKNGGLTPKEIVFFYSFFKEKTYKRNTTLLTEGQVAHEVYFLLEGALRQYFINEEGIEKTCNFSFELDFLTDLESFSRQSRASTNIITMEPSTCLVITCKDLATAIRESVPVADLCRAIIESVATENIKRTKALLSSSPEKRYSDLIFSKPQIQQRIPQRYIAQYLGIAPESLSRIRRRLLTTEKS